MSKTVEKVLKFAPGKKSAGIVKGKKSVTNIKNASPSGKKSATGTTDEMTMQTLKKFLQFQKLGKKGGATLIAGKRSAGNKK